MNNIFDFRRFGNYLLYDLNNLKNRYGISLLLIGLAPIIVFVVLNFLSLIFKGGAVNSTETQFVVFVLSYVVLGLSAPAKIYGLYTEKKAGSNWILLPVSTVEKILSMIIILIIVVPGIFIVLQTFSNLLLSLAIPDSLVGLASLLGQMNSEMTYQSSNLFAIAFWGNAVNMLLFALGALFFKKHKINKTILCDFAISVLLFIVFVRVFLNTWNFSPENLAIFIEQDIFRFINISAACVMGGEILLTLSGLYFRIKKMQF